MAPQINYTKSPCAGLQFGAFPFDENYMKNDTLFTHVGLSSRICFGDATLLKKEEDTKARKYICVGTMQVNIQEKKHGNDIGGDQEGFGNQQGQDTKQRVRPSQVGGPIHLGVGHLGFQDQCAPKSSPRPHTGSVLGVLHIVGKLMR